MSDRMSCMSFGQIMEWILEEKKKRDTVFGVHRGYVSDTSKKLDLFGRKLENRVFLQKMNAITASGPQNFTFPTQ